METDLIAEHPIRCSANKLASPTRVCEGVCVCVCVYFLKIVSKNAVATYRFQINAIIVHYMIICKHACASQTASHFALLPDKLSYHRVALGGGRKGVDAHSLV